MQPDDEKVGRRLLSPLDDARKGVVKQDLGRSNDTFNVLQSLGQFTQQLTCIANLLVDDPAWSIIIHYVHDLEGSSMLAGKDDRPAQCTIRAHGKIGDQHDALHGLLSCARHVRHEGTTDRFDD